MLCHKRLDLRMNNYHYFLTNMIVLRSLFIFLACISIIFPLSVGAEYDPKIGLISCDGIVDPCDFEDVLETANMMIDFLIFTLAMPLAAIIFAWAGFLFITGGADPGKRTKAKGMMLNVVIGLVIALAAWLIVKTILLALGYDGPLFLAE